jgi:Icc-related predicted phosphoesterase
MFYPPIKIFQLNQLTVQVISDIHIDSWRGKDHLPAIERGENADLLIIAGDLSNGPKESTTLWLKALLENENWPLGALMVLGNHDYYHGKLSAGVSRWREALTGLPIRILQKETVDISGVTFAGTTLWTDFDKKSPFTMLQTEFLLSDYRYITREKTGIRAIDTYDAHKEELAWLSQQTGENLVFITHHAPSFSSVSREYQGDPLNGAFVSNLHSVIEKCSPQVWIHGHVHSRHDYDLGETRIICNPIGYPNERVY